MSINKGLHLVVKGRYEMLMRTNAVKGEQMERQRGVCVCLCVCVCGGCNKYILCRTITHPPNLDFNVDIALQLTLYYFFQIQSF